MKYVRRVLQYHEFFKEVSIVGYEVSADGLTWLPENSVSMTLKAEPKPDRYLPNDK